MSRAKKILDVLSRTERWLLVGAVVLVLVSGSAILARFFEESTAVVPVSGGVFTEGISGQPVYINPVIAATDADRDLAELIYSDLPEMADAVKSADNGRIWSVFLKENIFWSDGERITSDDVIFTVETVKSADVRSPLLPAWQGVAAERVSEREVKFVLRSPYAFFGDTLKNFKPLPRHLFGAIPAANLRLSLYNLEPVSSGPYQFSSSEKRRDGFITAYRLKINERHFGQKPFVSEFVFKFYPNETDLIAAFNAKEIDALGGINPKNLERLTLDKNVLTLRMPRYYAIFFNQNAHPALKEKNVREALSLAVNKSDLIEKVFNGRAMAVGGPITPDLGGYDPALYKEKYSPEEARNLLEKSKFIPDNNGVRLEFKIALPQIGFLIETVNLVKAEWERIGVRLNPVVLDSDAVAQVIKNRDYEMIIFGNILSGNPDLFSFWHSSEKFYPGLNLSLYENKKVDQLIESVRQNQSGDRDKDVGKALELIENDWPAVFLFSPVYLYVTEKSVAGPKEDVIRIPSDRLKNVSEWYVKTARTAK